VRHAVKIGKIGEDLSSERQRKESNGRVGHDYSHSLAHSAVCDDSSHPSLGSRNCCSCCLFLLFVTYHCDRISATISRANCWTAANSPSSIGSLDGRDGTNKPCPVNDPRSTSVLPVR